MGNDNKADSGFERCLCAFDNAAGSSDTGWGLIWVKIIIAAATPSSTIGW